MLSHQSKNQVDHPTFICRHKCFQEELNVYWQTCFQRCSIESNSHCLQRESSYCCIQLLNIPNTQSNKIQQKTLKKIMSLLRQAILMIDGIRIAYLRIAYQQAILRQAIYRVIDLHMVQLTQKMQKKLKSEKRQKTVTSH